MLPITDSRSDYRCNTNTDLHHLCCKTLINKYQVTECCVWDFLINPCIESHQLLAFIGYRVDRSYPVTLWGVIQTVRSYCLSRDCPISCACRLKFRLKKPSQRGTLQQKSPLHNYISPPNIKYSFKITKSLTGDKI